MDFSGDMLVPWRVVRFFSGSIQGVGPVGDFLESFLKPMRWAPNISKKNENGAILTYISMDMAYVRESLPPKCPI